MNSVLRRLFDEILLEAERRPEFGSRLEKVIHGALSQAECAQPSRSTRRNRRAPGPFDPFEVFKDGEGALRDRLKAISVDQLKDVISEHAMDSSRLALKWRSRQRLTDLIVSTVRARLEKGDAFKRVPSN